jgi:hypothetical protein
VIDAAEAALARQKHVSIIDVLVGMRLLAESNVEAWRKGRLEFLEEMIPGSANKISSTFDIFLRWVRAKGLKPAEGRYVRPTKSGGTDLRVTHSGDPEMEKFFRTHWISPALSGSRQEKLEQKLNKAPQPVVFLVIRDSQCSECGVELGRGFFLFMEGSQPLCLACARMADLEFLPSGDTALTRRAGKYSGRSAVVVEFSRSRKRYERQGLLVETAALEKAEQECTEDADERAAARVRGRASREQQDKVLVEQMKERILELFPRCPPAEAAVIAKHTAVRGSGRVGRTEAGRSLDERAITAAVIASIRHNHTNYEELLARGVDRELARERIADKVADVLEKWRG